MNQEKRNDIDNYELFKKVIVEDLQKHLEEDAQVEVKKVLKNNGIELDGICVFLPGEFATPTVYIDVLYQQYKHGESYDVVLDKVLHCYKDKEVQWKMRIDFYRDFSLARHKILFRIVQREKNQKFLSTVPHRQILDFAIVYYCIVEDEKCGWGTITVSNEHMNMWHTTEEELYSSAMENVMQIVPPQILNLQQIVKELYVKVFQEKNCGGLQMEESAFDPQMYILTNSRKNFGAAVLFYPAVLQKFADEVQSDFYILPSSVHEVILLCTNEAVEEKTQLLEEMINDVNQDHLLAEEFLSEHVYYYSREENKISLL